MENARPGTTRELYGHETPMQGSLPAIPTIDSQLR
jgi:hypothetical protein